MYEIGSKEAGQKWTEIAENLNCHGMFQEMPRDQRSVRDQFNKLIGNYKRKKTMEEKSSGVSPNPPTENESILEDILEIMESTPIRNPVIVLKNEEKKREEALATSEIAMNTWKKAEKCCQDENEEDSDIEDQEELEPKPAKKRKRRSCADPIQYLVQKTANEKELSKEELELRRKELQLKAEEQKQQFELQQLHMQQMIESQKNTQKMFIAVIEKLSK